MNGTYPLKLFVSVSLGLHLFVFSVLSFLIPDQEFRPRPRLNIEVSFLPLEKQIMETPKKLRKPYQEKNGERLAQENVNPAQRDQSKDESSNMAERIDLEKPGPSEAITHVIHEDSQMKKTASLSSEKEQPKASLTTVQSEQRTSLLPQPLSSSIAIEKQKEESSQVESVIVASMGQSLPSPNLPEKAHVATKESTFSEKEIIWVQPRYAENPRPLYPREARRKGYQGEVLLKVQVLSNGTVGEVEVKRSSGYELLDHSAITAVKAWKFSPARKGETPITAWVHIPIAFQLR